MLLAIPGIGWLYQHGELGWAVFLALWVLLGVRITSYNVCYTNLLRKWQTGRDPVRIQLMRG